MLNNLKKSSSKMKAKSSIAIILGTRPELIKLSPVIRALQHQNRAFFLIHTNQHYSANMDAVFFDELRLPKPKYNLNVQESLHGVMTAKMLIGIEEILMKEKPDWVIVQGDTNTVLAGGLASAKLGIKVAHVEAGLRSYDRTMPEEINRVVVDHLSDALFAPTQKQAEILKNEGIEKDKIHVVGNTIVDAVQQNLEFAKQTELFKRVVNSTYFLLTLHRPANVDNKASLESIILTVEGLAKKHGAKVLFPVHPRTKKMLDQFGIKLSTEVFEEMEPVGYLEMLALQVNALVILTDSGGIQEEACILQVPCITLREHTERPETIDVGASVLAGSDPKKIEAGVKWALRVKRDWSNPFGDGESGEKIVEGM